MDEFPANDADASLDFDDIFWSHFLNDDDFQFEYGGNPNTTPAVNDLSYYNAFTQETNNNTEQFGYGWNPNPICVYSSDADRLLDQLLEDSMAVNNINNIQIGEFPSSSNSSNFSEVKNFITSPIVGGYSLLSIINSGSYGVVYKACNSITGETVAIKEELYGMSPSTQTEISILESLPPHPSIVQMKEVKLDSWQHVFVVMEYVELDLNRLMNIRKRHFSLAELKKLMKQILEGVDHLHSHGVMHRDLKPSNILVDANAVQAKLCDFGLSTETGSNTPGVVTLWYRAPEVLKGNTYTDAIDMWSVGCIMAELVLRRVLFPGTSEIDQLACIERTMDAPHVFQQNLSEAASVEGAPPLSWRGIGLLHQLLCINPKRRITAREAVNHDWFKE